MSVTVRCPHPACGKPSSVPGEHLGRTVRCPHCQLPFTAATESDPAMTASYDAVRATLKGPPPSAPSADLPPAVGRFQVRSRLGQGAFGAVYRAYDPQLDREIALKVPLPGALDTPQRVKRFLREARAAAGLRHPHIVPVFDAGGDPPHCYIAAAFIDGRTLAGSLRDGPMDFRRAARLTRELAGALAYAHRQGILHRDVKPANVMLDTADEAHLTDFGLAHRLEGAEKLTQDGALLGTPAYMAPEHVAEPGREPQPAGDQYSLGVVLYELLCGRLPFEGTPEVVLFNALHTEPAPPRVLRPGVPRDLETVCLKAMARRPQDRYADCDALADDLRRWLEGEPIRARRTSLVARTVKWARRRPAQALAVVFLAACMVLAVGYLITAANLRETEALKTLADERATGEESLRKAAEAAANTEQQLRKDRDAALVIAKQEHERAEVLLSLNRVNNAFFQWKEARVTRAEALLEACPQPLRNWDWYYVRRLCRAAVITLRGHTNDVNGVCFSPDGRYLASASEDETVRIWDAATGTEERSLTGHGAVGRVCFSPDGKRLASAGGDMTVSVWDVATRKEELTLKGHTEAVFAVCFSRDGKRLASGGGDKTVRLWDAVTGKEERTLTGHEVDVYGVCFSPDGRRLASASQDQTVRVWDTATGKQTRKLKAATYSDAPAVAFSPDGRLLAASGEDGAVNLWDAATGKELRTLDEHTDDVNAVCFSPDGRHLASASDDQTVRIWDVTTGKEERTIAGHTAAVLGVCYSPDGRRLATASKDRTIRIWNLQIEPEARPLQGHTGPVNGVRFSPDGKRLASASGDGTVRVWDVGKGQGVFTLNGHTKGITGVCFSPDGQLLASPGARRGTIRLWDAGSGQERRTIVTRGQAVTSVCFSPDGKLLASGGFLGQPVEQDGDVKLWDVATGDEQRSFPAIDPTILSIAYSPDGDYVASAGNERIVRLWGVKSGKEERSFSWDAELNYMTGVCVSPDGKWLAAVGDHRTIKVWDVATGKEALTLEGHVGSASAVCFSPDSKRLASGGDGGVKIWDATTGQEALSLNGHKGWVNSICFSPDGRWIASGGEDGTVLLWDSGPR